MSLRQVLPAPAPSLSQGRSRAGPASARRLAPVRAWLWLVAGCILAMVVVGGATRLTQSGLSITEWKPVMGAVPPLSAEAWQAEFDRYKQIPQYAELNRGMDLAGFKAIFYWEWAHRLWGRLVGVLVAVPLAAFWVAGRLTPRLKPRLVGLLALGGLQGVIGWFMVRSGLSERTEVSQYFLALHLVTASLTLVYTIWLAEGLRPTRAARAFADAERLRRTAGWLLALVLVQVGLGAFVAGLHAGLIDNTWPLMNGHVVPPAADLFPRRPPWANPFENPETAQFDHRMTAYLVFAVALIHALDARRRAPGTGAARRAMLLAGLVAGQAAIGIATLLLVVPLWAALLHQGFAMVVLGAATLHRRRLAVPVLGVARSSPR